MAQRLKWYQGALKLDGAQTVSFSRSVQAASGRRSESVSAASVVFGVGGMSLLLGRGFRAAVRPV